jgi:hypothetical protein
VNSRFKNLEKRREDVDEMSAILEQSRLLQEKMTGNE